jgi:hypothetical protein
MLKIIALLDCNSCGRPFDQVSISTDRDPRAWRILSDEVEYLALNRGWSTHRAAHYCDLCADAALRNMDRQSAPIDTEPDF